MLGVGASKKQEVMTSHVSTDNPICCRYSPISGIREVVHKNTHVGVISDQVGETDTP